MKVILFNLLFLISAFSSTIQVGGFIYGPHGEAISGARVAFAHETGNTLTSDNGFFMLDGSTPISNAPKSKGSSLELIHNQVRITLLENSEVSLSLYRMNGQLISRYAEKLAAGIHSLPLTSHAHLATGVYLLRAKIGSHSSVVKVTSLGGNYAITQREALPGFQKATPRAGDVVVDTLIISKEGYRTKRELIDSYTRLFNALYLSELGVIYDSSDLVNNDIELINSNNTHNWTDVAWNGNDTSDHVTAVIFDSAAAIDDTLFSVRLIRNTRSEDTTGYKTAAAGVWINNAFTQSIYHNDTTYGWIEVTYQVAKPSDTLAFYLAPEAYEGSFNLGYVDTTTGVNRYYSVCRAVLTSGAENPGTFVTDTLYIEDFSMKYGQDNRQLMDTLGYVVNGDGNVYLKENLRINPGLGQTKISLSDIGYAAFEGESEENRLDTIDLKVSSIRVVGNFQPDTIHTLPLIESAGWLPVYDSTSSVKSEWNNGTTTVHLTRGASNEQQDTWAHAGVVGVLNPAGNLEHLQTISITYVVPDEGDTVALSIERGARLGAGDIDDNRFGSFRAVIPFAPDSIDSAYGMIDEIIQTPGDTVTIEYSLDNFTMNWGDDPDAPYHFGDTITAEFLREANAIGIFSEKDNGTYGAAADGDSVRFQLLDITLTGPHGLELDILPLTSQQE